MCIGIAVPNMAWELTKEWSNLSRGFYGFVNPGVDIAEEGNELVVRIDLPGFTKEDINLRIVENMLYINAKRRKESEEELRGATYYRGRPIRIDKKIVLPISTKDGEKLVGTAKYVEGVLTIRIPIPRSTKIEIT